LGFWEKVERREIEAILIVIEKKPCVAGNPIIHLCNETLSERVIEQVEERGFGIVDVEIGPKVAFRNEARVCGNPGLPDYSANGREIIFPPGSDNDSHG
jgi:hypothetical protein